MISSMTVIAARGFASLLPQFTAGDCAHAHCVDEHLFPPCRLTVGHYLFWARLARAAWCSSPSRRFGDTSAASFAGPPRHHHHHRRLERRLPKQGAPAPPQPTAAELKAAAQSAMDGALPRAALRPDSPAAHLEK